MGGGRGPGAVKYANELAVKQARGETEPVPIETGKLTGKMATYAQMRVNPAKGIGYGAIEAAAKIKAPTMILVAENEELMKNDDNGKRVFEIVQGNQVPAEYHVLPGITHYGVYRDAFAEATQLEAAWFKQYLTPKTGN
jgi:hypothetical protein